MADEHDGLPADALRLCDGVAWRAVFQAATFQSQVILLSPKEIHYIVSEPIDAEHLADAVCFQVASSVESAAL